MVLVQKQHPKRHRVSFAQNSPIEKLEDAKKPSPTATHSSSPHIGESLVSDVFQYLHEMEMQKKRRPMVDYIEKVQELFTPTMRGILVDWLVEVGEEYKLLPDTLHLSVSYIDRFLSVNPVTKSRLQLLGFSSMLIASKYEEIDLPCVDDFCSITDHTYDKEEVVKMEADILQSLKFEMGNPTVNTFLRRFVDVASDQEMTPNSQIEFLSQYLAELSLLDYDCLRFLPSVVAASAVFLSRFIISPEVHPWSYSLSECSGYKPAELKECVEILHDLYLLRKAASFEAVKYKQQKFKCIANLSSPPYIPNCYFEDDL